MDNESLLKIIERDLVEEPLITPVSPAINVSWVDCVQIRIIDVERRPTAKNLSLKENTEYLIETRVTNPLFTRLPFHSMAWRKEEEFENFRQFLASTYPYIILPPLSFGRKTIFFPFLKRALSSDLWDIHHPLYGANEELENFLNRIKDHPTLSEENELTNFLTKEEPWIPPLLIDSPTPLRPEKAFWQLSKIKHPDRKIEALKNYTVEFQKTVGTLFKTGEELALKKLEMLQAYQEVSHHLHYMKLDDKSLNNACHKAAFHLDSFVADSRAGVGDDRALTKVLMEQFHYAESVLEVCRHQEALQTALEKNEELHAAKIKQRQDTPLALMALPTWSSVLGTFVPCSFTSSEKFIPFLGKLMGRDASHKSQDQRMIKLNECIEELEKNSNIIKEEKKRFTELAHKDIALFQGQKAQKIKEALQRDVHHQIMLNKNIAMSWLSIKQTFEAL